VTALEIEAAPVPGLAWPGSWLSSGGGAISLLGLLGLLGCWVGWGLLEPAAVLANGCACAERVRSGVWGPGGSRRRVKRPKAANYHQWAGSPALGFFLLVTASCRPFHQAVSSVPLQHPAPAGARSP
jgi:hypothetical protein